MLTYDLTNSNRPLYQTLYECIRADIQAGKLRSGAKMPSKRTLADNLGVSTITVENAYDQLIGEGYLTARPRRGYYVADMAGQAVPQVPLRRAPTVRKKREAAVRYDFSSNSTARDDFPFSVWARLMRETLSCREQDFLTVSPCEGVWEVRAAISEHLRSFRGMNVDPDQIIVGAGTETLYGLLIQLLGRDAVYCIENPGYKKLRAIYDSWGVRCTWADLDSSGMDVAALRATGADVAHISPNHHFPTGITMPVSRRYELLAWANEAPDRYIIEDDYDSEFRLSGRPIPPLESIDACGRVIYMNTFSKSLTATIRISYMVLPEELANRFFEKLSFYANTVSTFEQYTLASFISEGYFEKHINRMRLRYGRKKTRVLEAVRSVFNEEECRILENDSGLHMVLRFCTDLSDRAVEEQLAEQGIRICAITDYEMDKDVRDRHAFILNYSSLELSRLPEALGILRGVLYDGKRKRGESQ